MSNIIIPKNFIDGNKAEWMLDDALEGVLHEGIATAEDDPVHFEPIYNYKDFKCQLASYNGIWIGVGLNEKDGIKFETKPQRSENEAGRELHKYIDIYRRSK